MSKALPCRRVRDWLQEQHDREGPASLAEGQLRAARPWQEASPLAQAAEVHLEGCPECRRFREFLESYGRELAASLDTLSGRPPLPDTAAAAARHAAPQRGRVPARGARGSVARWAVPAAAAALLAIAAGTQAPRLAASVRVETPSFPRMFETCTPAVDSLMKSSSAIWRFVRPAATRARTSRSRGVRPKAGWRGPTGALAASATPGSRGPARRTRSLRAWSSIRLSSGRAPTSAVARSSLEARCGGR